MSNSTAISVVRFPFTLDKSGKPSFGKEVYEDCGSHAKAFLLLGLDKSESRMTALNGACIHAPYVIKISEKEYGAIIPEHVVKDEYVVACRTKIEKKVLAKSAK